MSGYVPRRLFFFPQYLNPYDGVRGGEKGEWKVDSTHDLVHFQLGGSKVLSKMTV